MKYFVVLITSVIICACSCSKELEKIIDQDFLSDLGSENNRMNGDLSLDYFNNDLSNLTYDFYLTYITKNEAPSARGFSTKVKNADYHYFISQKNSFVIALFYKTERTIICDNSNTSFLDSTKTYGLKDTIPELSKFAIKLLNR